jgi:hypothetical protein
MSERANHVWAADITYLPMPMRRGFAYLVAVMDWASPNKKALCVWHRAYDFNRPR